MPAAPAQDLIVPAGQTVVLGTNSDRSLSLRRLEFQPSGVLFVMGVRALSITASAVRIDGTLLATGRGSAGVGTLNTTNIPEVGAAGGPGGGTGGTGSFLAAESTAVGGAGSGSYNIPAAVSAGGGLGGETSFSLLGDAAAA